MMREITKSPSRKSESARPNSVHSSRSHVKSKAANTSQASMRLEPALKSERNT